MNNVMVNGYKIHAFSDRGDFLEQIQDKKTILIAMNAEKILKEDSRLKEIVNRNTGYADGIGAVMALRQKGLLAVKIAGAEFWLDIIEKYKDEKSFYLLGASQEVIIKTVDRLRRDFSGIDIKGYRNGYLKPDDLERIKEDLIRTKPDIVFVAQGSPRQEFLMDDLLSIHSALYMGLGGSFDVYCGLKNRAPIIFQKLCLEWLYRLLKEPTRIGRQLTLSKFLLSLLLKRL